MEKMMNSSSIPEEITFEIFSWLPVKSLMRFKCVSGFCNSLVSESDFVDIHSCRSMTRSGGTKFLLHERDSVFYSAEQKDDGKDSAPFLRCNELYDPALAYSWLDLDCVNGLFCVRGALPAAIFNPSTREVRFLPNLSEDFSPLCYSLGFEPEENKYKVLSTTHHVQEACIKHWVFTLGIDESWRETQSISFSTPYFRPSVCITGVIYQFFRDNECAIAAFDVKSEKFKSIALWNASPWGYNYELIEVKGKLGIIDYGKWVIGYLDLWILQQTQKREWERHTTRLPSIWNDTPNRNTPCFVSHDGEIVFVVNLNSGALCCLCYVITRKSWKELEIKGLPNESSIEGIYSYVESLVSFG